MSTVFIQHGNEFVEERLISRRVSGYDCPGSCPTIIVATNTDKGTYLTSNKRGIGDIVRIFKNENDVMQNKSWYIEDCKTKRIFEALKEIYKKNGYLISFTFDFHSGIKLSTPNYEWRGNRAVPNTIYINVDLYYCGERERWDIVMKGSNTKIDLSKVVKYRNENECAAANKISIKRIPNKDEVKECENDEQKWAVFYNDNDVVYESDIVSLEKMSIRIFNKKEDALVLKEKLKHARILRIKIE